MIILTNRLAKVRGFFLDPSRAGIHLFALFSLQTT